MPIRSRRTSVEHDPAASAASSTAPAVDSQQARRQALPAAATPAFEGALGLAAAERGPMADRAPAADPRVRLRELSGYPGLDAAEGHPIPRHIHRFWTGGPMSEAAMANLEASADKSRDSGWQSTLWHSSEADAALDARGVVSSEAQEQRASQRAHLHELGYEVRAVEELASPEPPERSLLDRLRGRHPEDPRQYGQIARRDLHAAGAAAADKATTDDMDRWDGLKAVSDVARLMALHAEGGLYLDVDIGLGTMDLDRGYFHNDPAGEVPLAGALAATGDGGIGEQVDRLRGERDLDDADTADAARAVFAQAEAWSASLNAIIASRAGNPRLADALEAMRADMHTGLPGGMLAAGLMVRGDERQQTLAPYVLDLEHFTEESGHR